MNILIIEDETRAANRIEKLLNEMNSSYTVIGVVESIAEGLNYLNKVSPDLIISDIQLADGLSFELFNQVKISCPIIFTTAYDHYAIQAFETNGIDYLLKPIEKARLEKALHKLSQFNSAPALPPNFEDLLKNALNQENRKAYKTRFMIKVGDKIKAIPVNEIKAFYSLEKGTYLLTDQLRNYVLEHSLEQLMEMIDPTLFFRINRKFIVRIDAPKSIISHTNSRLKLIVEGYEYESIIVAREKVQAFKMWLDQ